jgi:hypothetical protein
VKQQDSTTRKLGLGFSAEVSAASVAARGTATGERNKCSERGETFETSETIEFLRVRAISDLRWEVSEHSGPLNGTYLEEDRLLSMEKVDRANLTSFRATVTVKQRDIAIREIEAGHKRRGLLGKFSTNQSRLFDIFVAKSMSAAQHRGGNYRGEIQLSEYTNEDLGEI